jgi:hypothetical protein
MDEFRELVLKAPLASGCSTTAENPDYLSWNALVYAEQVLQHCPSARVLDFRSLPKYQPTHAPVLLKDGKHSRLCDVHQLVQHMSQNPTRNEVLQMPQPEFEKLAFSLLSVNFRAKHHNNLLLSNPWSREAQQNAMRRLR